ncbi:MAG TPA: YrdB family protein [Trueperaceae bacterium]
MSLKDANLAVRFLLELATLVALGYWGFGVGAGALQRFALGLGAPLLAALLWGLFVAPRSRARLAEPLRYGIGLLIMLAGALALAASGEHSLALVFALVILLNTSLVVLWRP